MSDPQLADGRSVSFRRLCAADEERLTAYFAKIRADSTSTGFRPHPFDADTARVVAAGTGRDMYVVGLTDGDFVAYGMLRGWDANYEVPSLGIYVSPVARGSSVAEAFMGYLHGLAAGMGSSTVRLTVDEWNGPALRLYRRLGYSFTTYAEPGRLVGTVNVQSWARRACK
jgi:ribosomal protein S18 acetylase RimI-like enzyme